MNNKNDKKDIVVPNNERGPINGDTERRSGYEIMYLLQKFAHYYDISGNWRNKTQILIGGLNLG